MANNADYTEPCDNSESLLARRPILEVRAGFVIHTGENQIVAFSRMCPKQRDHILNFVLSTVDSSCGCPDESWKGYSAM
jgi:hypothetical protein